MTFLILLFAIKLLAWRKICKWKFQIILLFREETELKISNFLHIKFWFPCRLRLYIHHIKQFWYSRRSNDTLTVNNPTLGKEEKESDNEESGNESRDGMVRPTVNHPVKLRLYNRWPSAFTVSYNMIRTPVLYKLKKEQFLTDGEKSSLLASMFDECVKHTLWVSYYVVFFLSFILTHLLELWISHLFQ